MGNSSGKNESPEHKYNVRTGIYPTCEWDEKKVKKMVLSKKLAPFFPPSDAAGDRSVECPICFFQYPASNRTLCCKKWICSECYLQVRKPDPVRSKCPFCNCRKLEVEYRGPKSDGEVEAERAEEQRIAESQRRQLEEERRRDEERRTSPPSERRPINLHDFGLSERDVNSIDESQRRASARSTRSGSARAREGPFVARVTNVPDEYADFIPTSIEVSNWAPELQLNYEELMLEEAIRMSLQSGSAGNNAGTASVVHAAAAPMADAVLPDLPAYSGRNHPIIEAEGTIVDSAEVDSEENYSREMLVIEKRMARELNGIGADQVVEDSDEQYLVELAIALSMSIEEPADHPSASSAPEPPLSEPLLPEPSSEPLQEEVEVVATSPPATDVHPVSSSPDSELSIPTVSGIAESDVVDTSPQEVTSDSIIVEGETVPSRAPFMEDQVFQSSGSTSVVADSSNMDNVVLHIDDLQSLSGPEPPALLLAEIPRGRSATISPETWSGDAQPPATSSNSDPHPSTLSGYTHDTPLFMDDRVPTSESSRASPPNDSHLVPADAEEDQSQSALPHIEE